MKTNWISEFWSDDVRGLTFTPAGRWISILDQFVQINSVPRETAIEAYFKVGIGLSDALVACWNSKYVYNLEAPGLYKEEHPRRLAGISSFSKFSKLSFRSLSHWRSKCHYSGKFIWECDRLYRQEPYRKE